MEHHVVFRRTRRPPRELAERAGALPVSDLYEALPPDRRDLCLMAGRIRQLNAGTRIAGPAITVQCAPGDNLMLHRALLLAEAGDVLVINGGRPSAAQWGYLAALYAERKGLAGVVVDGCIRDADVLQQRRYPVWCSAISPAHPTKKGPGSINVPVSCDGVIVRPGDVVAADADGVLVIAPDLLATAVEGAERRGRHEAKAATLIEEGRSLFEVHGLEAPFRDSGVKEVDGYWSNPATE